MEISPVTASAPGTSAPGVYRPGGPWKLVTGLGMLDFDRDRKRFTLASVHPGHSVEEILDNTGFPVEVPGQVPQTAGPAPTTLALLRDRVRAEIAETYPRFAATL